MEKKTFIHPYIPNSVPEIKAAMLKEVGLKSVYDVYNEIPEQLRFKDKLDIPEAITSEYALKRHVEEILEKNVTCREYLNFLGAGCWQHYVPAVVDEIVNRSEFLTAYCGAGYSDIGKYQARFEFNSLMGELLDIDAVSNPIYDWGDAAGRAIRMASRITGRNEVLVPKIIDPDRLAEIRQLCQPEEMSNAIAVRLVDYDPETGLMDLNDLTKKISNKTAAVYFETPSYLGTIEDQGKEITDIAHKIGALSIAGVDPITLGVLTPPGSYGTDLIVGDLQSIGVHMLAGGGQSGFIAFRDEEVYIAECPLEIYSIMETVEEGELAFAEVRSDRTSYGSRDKGKDWVGTASGLWTIAGAVYLTLMGPEGMREIGEVIVKNAKYTQNRLSEMAGVSIKFSQPNFKEFMVDFSGTGKSVAEINRGLLKRKVFGGKDISGEYPELGQCALFCVTEIHTKDDIDKLCVDLKEVLQ
ncbi:MAG: aminomethyl-transferring glycine dehydrogenase subunit GcvPA [Desulfobacterales bacterium]|nr:aminomethyl-transferring glycine dehydrogenase subunit GcvPA [Desulfobacterales bacterium]